MTGIRPNTWMPIYWSDYLADTGHLNAAEHGAYLLLIGHYWTTGKALVDNDKQLSRIARMTVREWQHSREVIMEFFQVSNGLWRHGRVEAELVKAAEKYARRAKAGAKGGSSNAKAMLKQTPTKTEAGLNQPQPHSLTGDSEPNGSDAVAVVVTPPDLRKSIFDDGLPWLATSSGKPEPSLRSLIGRWCRDHGDEGVLTTIRACMRSPPVDPVAWIERSLKGYSNGKRPNEPVSFTETVARLAAEKAQSHHS